MPELSMLEIPPYGIILDVLIIMAVAGLWMAWWRNLNRLQKTERLLADSIQQLEQASTRLKQAMDHILAFEKEKRAEEEIRTKNPPRKRRAPTAGSSSDTVLSRTLRLQRQGKSDNEIADNLSIPVNQVRLMLKMHATRTS
jgi:exonuclease VII large subunit